MPRSRRARLQFALRVDAELAALLRSLPNASEFIRQSVLRHSGLRCPLCLGSGVVGCGVGGHFGEVLRGARPRAAEDDLAGAVGASAAAGASAIATAGTGALTIEYTVT